MLPWPKFDRRDECGALGRAMYTLSSTAGHRLHPWRDVRACSLVAVHFNLGGDILEANGGVPVLIHSPPTFLSDRSTEFHFAPWPSVDVAQRQVPRLI